MFFQYSVGCSSTPSMIAAVTPSTAFSPSVSSTLIALASDARLRGPVCRVLLSSAAPTIALGFAETDRG